MSDLSPHPQAIPAEPSAGPLPKRIVDTIFSPSALFARFGSRPPWLDVAIITAVGITLPLALLPERLYVALAEQQVAMNPDLAGQGMTVERMASMSRIFGAAGGLIFSLVWLFVAAGVLTVIFRLLHGGQATYRQYLSVVAHAGIIGLLGTLLAVPLWLARDDLSVRFSLSLLTPFLDPESYPFKFLKALDLFTIWSLVVMGIGVRTLNRKVSGGAAFGWLFGILLAVAAVTALF